MPRKLSTSAVDAGAVLGAWLAARLGLAPAEATERVVAGAVYVDGRRERDPARPLRGGEKIVVHEPAAVAPARWRVVHEDPEILVVDKPAGLPVVAGRAGGEALADQVAARFPDAKPFHRIDQGTSGLVLFARGGGARRLAVALAAGTLVREYLAIVAPPWRAPPERLVLDAPIGPDPTNHRRMKAGVPGGKLARTELTFEGGGALVRARLVTGLTHQIRVHLAGAGHPIVGDALYEGRPAPRLALHATLLAWPGGSARSPLPEELEALVVP